jgi:hypothetical protein
MAAKLFAENQRLKSELNTMKAELGEAPASLIQKLKDNTEFTNQLQTYLKQAAEER